ncbi:hypothetical protein [Prevotella sp. P6B4]|uniref:hypothetical protein n=1 Tax=Prevotella sp. P6B4 TaxID=1410614 RepID=UPI00049103E7|nr:hypothetical protein [Prevotella sp. P6B4]
MLRWLVGLPTLSENQESMRRMRRMPTERAERTRQGVQKTEKKHVLHEKVAKKFGGLKKTHYLCTRV